MPNHSLDRALGFIIGSPAVFRTVLKSKIHCARITDADVEYEGSITIDRDLMDAADLVEYEEVSVWSVSGGQRLTTYVIAGPRGSGTLAMNGAAAHLIKKGEVVIVASFVTASEEELADRKVSKVFVDGDNRVSRTERCTYFEGDDVRQASDGLGATV
jgi:aspartate 1-decarboxylase